MSTDVQQAISVVQMYANNQNFFSATHDTWMLKFMRDIKKLYITAYGKMPHQNLQAIILETLEANSKNIATMLQKRNTLKEVTLAGLYLLFKEYITRLENAKTPDQYIAELATMVSEPSTDVPCIADTSDKFIEYFQIANWKVDRESLIKDVEQLKQQLLQKDAEAAEYKKQLETLKAAVTNITTGT